MASADKILVLGIDGMDPKLTVKYINEGKMPNFKTFMERGSQRADLVLLGGQPTVTPPMWTTLATGAYPVTHGITCFNRAVPGKLEVLGYNMDSRLCKAEQMWNVFAEAGKKTLVWHWPGAAWPPSSDSPNLSVVDGTQPSTVNMGARVDLEVVLVADKKTDQLVYKEKAATDANIPCVIADIEEQLRTNEKLKNNSMTEIENMYSGDGVVNLMLREEEGEHGCSVAPFDVIFSPIKEACGWGFDIPQDAKEFTVLLSHGLIHRPAIIIKNEQGIYDTVEIYKNKKTAKKIATLKKDEFCEDIIDEAIKDDKHYAEANRNMRIIELDEDGNHLKMWISSAMDFHNDYVWYPKSLLKEIVDHVGYPQPPAFLGGGDEKLVRDCMFRNWDKTAKWQAGSLNYLIDNLGYEVVFSHFHNIDMEGHMIIKYLHDQGDSSITKEGFLSLLERMYVQTDEYLGYFMHYLDEGWTIFVVSDHGQICAEHGARMMGDPSGVNVRVMQEMGLTVLKKDENGNDLYEIDWEHTKAIAQRGNHIYLNMKGRDEHGIIDPADKYEVEEEIITTLYNYKDPETGRRIISLAIRNKDAVLLGCGGPESGDILYWMAEGYNYDHCDSLSTTFGTDGTSVSPIFLAAGKGIKKGFVTDRIIRQVDVIPTIAVLGGVRMPAQCEGAPAYQILEKEMIVQ